MPCATENSCHGDNGVELQKLDDNVGTQRASTDVFPRPSEDGANREQRRCPRCRSPNIQENHYTIIYCATCSKPFEWVKAEKISTKQLTNQSSDTAPRSGSMLPKKGTLCDSLCGDDNLETKSHAKGVGKRSDTDPQRLDGESSRENAISEQESMGVSSPRKLIPETPQQPNLKAKHSNKSGKQPYSEASDAKSSSRRLPSAGPSKSALHDSKTTNNSENRFIEPSRSHKSRKFSRRTHSLPFSSQIQPIGNQPTRFVPMIMRPTADLSEAYATISAASETHKTAFVAKEPLRTRAMEIENYTDWQRMKWRCQMKPCSEAQEGCFYKAETRHRRTDTDGNETEYGDGDGCCEMMGCREFCCAYGCQAFGPAGCCEGGGCVQCCGFEHGRWDAMDVCFEEEGCVTTWFKGVKFWSR